MSGYYPGYSFAVRTTRDADGVEREQALYAEPWSHVHPRQQLFQLADGFTVECVAYVDGALAVRCTVNDKVAGWLG